jgi:hypothetical protein
VSARLQRRGRPGFAPDSLYADPGRLPGSATNTCLYGRRYDSPIAAVKPLVEQGSGVQRSDRHLQGLEINRLGQMGGLPEFEEALRRVRRVLARSHGE